MKTHLHWVEQPIGCKTQRIYVILFHSRSTWNVSYIAPSNLWDAKGNGTTTFMFDSRNAWNVIYIVRSIRRPPPTSTNIALATTHDPHDFLSSSHMKRSVQMTLMICLHHKWNVQCNKRSDRSHPQTSPKIAAAKKNESQDWSASSIKRPVQCAEHQASPSNITK